MRLRRHEVNAPRNSGRVHVLSLLIVLAMTATDILSARPTLSYILIPGKDFNAFTMLEMLKSEDRSYHGFCFSGSALSDRYSDLRWEEKSPLITARAYHALVTLQNKVYAIGGLQQDEPRWLDSVEVYDPSSDTWSFVQPMPTSRCSLVSAVAHDKIYVIGGTGNYEVLDKVEIYDPISNTWSIGASKPTPVAGAAVAVLKGKIWVLGGTQGWLDYKDIVEIYDPETNLWKTGPTLPCARVFAAAVTIGDRIYIMGGYNGQSHFLKDVHYYNTELREWTTASPSLIGRDSPAATVVNAQIALVGGSKDAGVGACADVELYNSISDEWRFVTPLPAERQNMGCGVVGQFLYVIGGTPNPYASIEKTNFRGEINGPDLTGTCEEYHFYNATNKIQLKVKVTNTGNIAAGPFKVGLNLSNNGRTPLTPAFKEVSVAHGLGVGQSTTLTINHRFATSIYGKYLLVFIDPRKTVAEVDETNNGNRIVIQPMTTK